MNDKNPRMRPPPSFDICGDYSPYPLYELKKARRRLIDDLYFSPGGGRIVHRIREISGILPNRQGRFIWDEMFPEDCNYCEQSAALVSKSLPKSGKICQEDVPGSCSSDTMHLEGFQGSGFPESQHEQDNDGNVKSAKPKRNCDGMIGSKSIDNKTIKPKSTDDKTIKLKSIDDKTIKPKSTDDKIIKFKGIDDKTIKPKSIDNKTIKPKSIDNKTIKPKSIDNETVKSKSTDDKTIKSKGIDDKTIKPKSMNDKTIKPKSIDDGAVKCKEIDDKTIKPKSIDDGAVKCKEIDDKTIKPKSIDDGAVKPKGIDDRTFKPKSIDNDTIKPKSTDDKTIKSKSIDDEAVKPKGIDDKAIKSKSIDDEAVKPKGIDDKAIKSKSIDDETIEDKDIIVKTNEDVIIKAENIDDETVIGEGIDDGIILTEKNCGGTVMIESNCDEIMSGLLNLRKRKGVNSLSQNVKKRKRDVSVDKVIEISSDNDISCEAFLDSVIDDVQLNIQAFKCDFCDYTAEKEKSIVDHLNTKLHHSASKYECLSSKGQLTPNYLLDEKSVVNEAVLYSSVVAICSYCYCVFKDIYACAKHMGKIHGKKRMYSLADVRKLQTVVMRRPKKCHDGSYFTPMRKLEKHILIKEDKKDKSYERPKPNDIVFCFCPLCNFTSNSIIASKNHMLSHFDSKAIKTTEFKVLFVERTEEHEILPSKIKCQKKKKGKWSRKKRQQLEPNKWSWKKSQQPEVNKIKC